MILVVNAECPPPVLHEDLGALRGCPWHWSALELTVAALSSPTHIPINHNTVAEGDGRQALLREEASSSTRLRRLWMLLY